jgi:hypothetical protein
MFKGKNENLIMGMLYIGFFSISLITKKLQTKYPKSCIVYTLCHTKLMTIEDPRTKLRKGLISYFKHYAKT